MLNVKRRPQGQSKRHWNGNGNCKSNGSRPQEMKRTSGQRECSVELRLRQRYRQSGKEAKRPLCDRKLTSKAELKDFPPHHPTKFWWIIKYGQCKEEAAAEEYAETPSWGGDAKKSPWWSRQAWPVASLLSVAAAAVEREGGGRGCSSLWVAWMSAQMNTAMNVRRMTNT